MPHTFRLFWLRETGCDAGTLLRADELVPEIQETVLSLARAKEHECEETVLRLPFLDKIEWRRRGEILGGLSWQREGDEIHAELSSHAAVRDLAAQLALGDPAWSSVPAESNPDHFRVWQSVSLALQRALRTWIAEAYFADIGHFDDRAAAYAMLVYESARLYHGRAPIDFTYDLRDYPHCLLTVALAMKMSGRTLQTNLARSQRRLEEAGSPTLARRYAPRWYEDILRGVRSRPRSFIELLAAERRFVNAVIDLGTSRSASGVNHFAKASTQALRNVWGMDLRALALRALHLTTNVLEQQRDGMVEVNPHECLRTP
ncbi:MAG TPA: hypothetical protein VGN17_05545 [Bryobacteraceae bacterium]|jgi:hypothetical protein